MSDAAGTNGEDSTMSSEVELYVCDQCGTKGDGEEWWVGSDWTLCPDCGLSDEW